MEAPAHPRMAQEAKAMARLARLQLGNRPTNPSGTKPNQTNPEDAPAWSKSRLESLGRVTEIGTARRYRWAPMGSCRLG